MHIAQFGCWISPLWLLQENSSKKQPCFKMTLTTNHNGISNLLPMSYVYDLS